MPKIQCIACGGNNFYVTPEKNITGYCFNCGYAEFNGTYKAVERFHDIPGLRQYYKELAWYYHSSMTADARTYLHTRGITDAMIDAYSIGFCPNDTHILYQDDLAKHAGLINRGKPFLADRVTFPYIVGSQVTDIRGRSLEPKTEYRYLSPKGSSYFRGADYPYLYEGESVLITEGEIKAIFAKEAGFTVHGIPGINAMRPKTSGMVVCFDSSNRPRSRQAVFRAIVHLGAVFPYLKVVTLPLNGSERDIGIDDYILAYGVDSFKKLMQRALAFDTWKRLYAV